MKRSKHHKEIQTESSNDAQSPYHSLSPVENADPNGHYSSALLWALKNREKENIQNIALTGPYGSGKSSILKTFEKAQTDRDLVFLNISLATFKEEKDSNATTPVSDTQTLRLIELSILQQIFYHEEDATIPDTRFKKVRNFPNKKVWRIALFIFTFAASLLYQIFPQSLPTLLRCTFPKWLESTIHYITAFCTVIGFFTITYHLIRPLRNIRLKKFNFQDAEFDVDESISKSILNDHLDEILYFFEVTDYTVVIIEDLDRFEQTEIFTKLRELNHLINYSKKIKRKVTFIYAVRDDMFLDKDRTKFFDFIIPVIPVINSSNSNEILLKIVSSNNYPISSDLLDDISLFVDDMRLLNNIMNEYHLYSRKLDPKLDQNKLLAIIVYKNIFPNDFVELNQRRGDLYNAVHNRELLITEKVKELEKTIKDNEQTIDQLLTLGLKHADELRTLYVLRYYLHHNNLRNFRVEDEDYNYKEMATADLFPLFEQKKVKYSFRNGNYTHYSDIKVDFTVIEKDVDPKFSYKERLAQIEAFDNNKIEDLRKEIAAIREEILSLKQRPIKQLLENNQIQIEISNQQQLQLISILLRFGHIDENYLDYISIFYEGSITRADKDFLLNVKAHIPTEFTHKLGKIDKLVSKIADSEFKNDYVFNFDLIDFLMANPKHQSLAQSVLKTLSNESKRSIQFIDGYLTESRMSEKLVAGLATNWPNMWHYLTTKSNFTEERIAFYYALIINSVEIETLKMFSNNSNFTSFGAQMKNILHIDVSIEKLEKMFSALDIKLVEPDYEKADFQLKSHVYTGNHYEINYHNLAYWAAEKGIQVNEEFDRKNYSKIRSRALLSGEMKMVKYIKDNIEEYLNNVWFKLRIPPMEDPTSLSELLNFNISLKIKQQIIDTNLTKVRATTDIKDKEIVNLLIQRNKIEPNWSNVLTYFEIEGGSITETIIDFFNEPENNIALGKEKILWPEQDDQRALISNFVRAFLLTEELLDSTYKLLAGVLPKVVNLELDIEHLSEEKVDIMLSLGFLDMNIENYEALRSSFTPKHIRLIEQDKSTFMKTFEDFTLDLDDVTLILSSNIFGNNEKSTILNIFDDSLISSDNRLLKAIGDLMVQDVELNLSSVIVSNVLKSNLQIDKIIYIFLKHHSLFDKREIFEIINYWPEPFSKIRQNGKQTVLSGTALYWEFANLLYSKAYIYQPKKDKKGIRIYNLRSE